MQTLDKVVSSSFILQQGQIVLRNEQIRHSWVGFFLKFPKQIATSQIHLIGKYWKKQRNRDRKEWKEKETEGKKKHGKRERKNSSYQQKNELLNKNMLHLIFSLFVKNILTKVINRAASHLWTILNHSGRVYVTEYVSKCSFHIYKQIIPSEWDFKVSIETTNLEDIKQTWRKERVVK